MEVFYNQKAISNDLIANVCYNTGQGEGNFCRRTAKAARSQNLKDTLYTITLTCTAYTGNAGYCNTCKRCRRIFLPVAKCAPALNKLLLVCANDGVS